MKQFRFLDWEVYKEAQTLIKYILDLTGGIPKKYQYSLSNQIVRSALSVVLNIAEGSGKESDKELNRFFEIALGSLYETLAGVDVLRQNNLIDEDEFIFAKDKIANVSRQLGGFKKKIRS